MIGMYGIYIKDLEKLKKIVEDPRSWKHYLWLTGGKKIVSAKLEMYEHPDGAKIAGKPGRWWVYIHTGYVWSDNDKPMYYDIALWKLKGTPVMERLIREGAITIVSDEERTISIP